MHEARYKFAEELKEIMGKKIAKISDGTLTNIQQALLTCDFIRDTGKVWAEFNKVWREAERLEEW